MGQEQLQELKGQWDYLLEKTIDKGQKLNEASRQQRFNTGIQDFKFWLSEVIAPGTVGAWELNKCGLLNGFTLTLLGKVGGHGC